MASKVASSPVAPSPLEPMLRLEQVLRMLGCSRSTLYAGIASGRYPAPIKNGKLSLWPTESIRAWLTNPKNFQTFAEAKAVGPRNLAKSAAFAQQAGLLVEVDRAMEVIGLNILLAHYDKYRAVNKPSRYDIDAATAVEDRLQQLKRGDPPSMHMLRRWKPVVRA